MRCCAGMCKSQEGRCPSRTLPTGGMIPPDPRNGAQGAMGGVTHISNTAATPFGQSLYHHRHGHDAR